MVGQYWVIVTEALAKYDAEDEVTDAGGQQIVDVEWLPGHGVNMLSQHVHLPDDLALERRFTHPEVTQRAQRKPTLLLP